MSKKLLDGLTYQQAQRRNSSRFNTLDRSTQRQLKDSGYRNKSWEGVCLSWGILLSIENKVMDMNVARNFRRILQLSNGDPIEALNILNREIFELCDQAIKELLEM